MRHLIFCLSTSLLTLFPASAQQPGKQKPIQAMVQAERNFSRMAAEKGTQAAFLYWMADDAVILKPEPVNAKQLYRERGDRPGLLQWEPIFASMAASGDFGFTTGPWEFKKEKTDSIPVAYGNFASIWKKQADGSWKVAVDLGISNPEPMSKPTLLLVESIPPTFQKQSRKSQTKNLELVSYDTAFSQYSEKNGVVQAYHMYADNAIRLLRMEHHPFIGKETINNVFATEAGKLTWKPAATEVATSNDLGYTYGSFTRLQNDGTITEKGYYMRVWQRKEKSEWRLVFDILLASPPEKSKE